MEVAVSVIVSILFHGLANAMILYIIAVGLSVTLGLMGFVNLAHGMFAMAGGYLAVTLMGRLEFPFAAAVILAALAVAAASVPLERLLYARLYGAGELEQVLFTIGLIFVSIAVAKSIFGPLSQPFIAPAALTGQIDLGFQRFPTYRALIIVVGLTIIVTLWLTIERTRFGAKVRAAVDNRRMAQSLGIHTDRLFTLTFALGSGLAALGGGLAVNIVGLTPTFAIQYLVFFLIVVSVGGLGSIRGTVLAALVLGIVDNAGKYLYPTGGAFFLYAATIILLLLRPAGLYGRN
jgi:branched-chain amino acid transport system permease protein